MSPQLQASPFSPTCWKDTVLGTRVWPLSWEWGAQESLSLGSSPATHHLHQARVSGPQPRGLESKSKSSVSSQSGGCSQNRLQAQDGTHTWPTWPGNGQGCLREVWRALQPAHPTLEDPAAEEAWESLGPWPCSSTWV